MFFAMLAVALKVPIALPTPAELELPTLRAVLVKQCHKKHQNYQQHR